MKFQMRPTVNNRYKRRFPYELACESYDRIMFKVARDVLGHRAVTLLPGPEQVATVGWNGQGFSLYFMTEEARMRVILAV